MIDLPIPFWGARKVAQQLQQKLAHQEQELNKFKAEMAELGALTVVELDTRRKELEQSIKELSGYHEKKLNEIQQQQNQLRETFAKTRQCEQSEHDTAITSLREQLARLQQRIVQTDEVAELQSVGVYEYQHPLQDVVSYQLELDQLKKEIKAMNLKDGGAIKATNDWTVNGSVSQGKRMVRESSKLMLRAFNLEADHLVRSLKPYKLDNAVDRLRKAAAIIEDLGTTMKIQVSLSYLKLRIKELELTADYLHKLAEEKEAEREERERLREERKAQQEMERERARLEKERQHYTNALQALIAKGDQEAAARMQAQLDEVAHAISDVDYRTANIRAGYVYVISNIGAFGETMVKIGMTRRLDPMDRVRELGDASVPFNFDVHALFFSKDAVGIETAMHQHFAPQRVNKVNLRREFFQVSALQAKDKLAELAGDLLQFQDLADAIEWRESIAKTSIS